MEKIKAKQMAILVTSVMFFTGLCFTGSVKADNGGGNIYDVEIMEVCNELFDALKSGDTKTLARLFDGEMLEKNRDLLEKNKGYPKFLRNYYRGATFEVFEIVEDDEGIMAGFLVNFPDGNNETMHLHLAMIQSSDTKNLDAPKSRVAVGKRWIISNQIDGIELEAKRRKHRKE